jgi:hypothetical protein
MACRNSHCSILYDTGAFSCLVRTHVYHRPRNATNRPWCSSFVLFVCALNCLRVTQSAWPQHATCNSEICCVGLLARALGAQHTAVTPERNWGFGAQCLRCRRCWCGPTTHHHQLLLAAVAHSYPKPKSLLACVCDACRWSKWMPTMKTSQVPSPWSTSSASRSSVWTHVAKTPCWVHQEVTLLRPWLLPCHS